ncbi:hypothetical protein ACHWQZ_G013943 [Mnemiopsis leidyi]
MFWGRTSDILVDVQQTTYTGLDLERVLAARIHSKHINVSVVVGYAPTEDSDTGVKDDFYQQLTDTFDELPGHDIKILLGDFNARVTSDNSAWPGVLGRHSLHSSSNDNGRRLIDFCAMHGLTIGGTMFQHRDIHKGTWLSPDGRTVTQIDHVCITTKWARSLLDVKSCRGADVGSDHYLVRGKLRVKFKAVEKIHAERKKIPAIENLRNQSKVEEFNLALHNRFSCLPVEEDLEAQWSNIKKTIKEVSTEVLGERPCKRKQYHHSQQTTDLIAERARIKRLNPTSDANKSEYSRVNKLVKKSSKRDDQNWAARAADNLENAASKGQQREVWQQIRLLSGKKKKKTSAVRDSDGRIISDPSKQRDRWKEYFHKLLNPNSGTIDLSSMDSLERNPCFSHLSDDDGPPTRNEILTALKSLKNCKSPGADEITNEQLKYGRDGLVDRLEALFSKVWISEAIPCDWLKGIVAIVPKKGDLSHCNNNRGITLRSTASKLYQIILLRRLNDGLERLLRENQCGFRKNRSCVDQIYTLRSIIHNFTEYNLPMYINFVDFKSAFDCINREFIWKALDHYGLPSKYIRIVQTFFEGTVSAVRVNGELTDWFDVRSGTGQGDIQGPPLFNVVLNLATHMAETNKEVSKGLVLVKDPVGENDQTVLDTDYADDIALLDDNKEGLQESTDLLSQYASLAGLMINPKKTECMAVGKWTSQRPFTETNTLDLTVDGAPIKQTGTFTYLGHKITSDSSLNPELDTRIQKASGAYNQLGNIWKNRNIQTSTKIRIYRAAVLTVLLYGSEVWNTTKTQIHRLEVFHQRCLRKIFRITWKPEATFKCGRKRPRFGATSTKMSYIPGKACQAQGRKRPRFGSARTKTSHIPISKNCADCAENWKLCEIALTALKCCLCWKQRVKNVQVLERAQIQSIEVMVGANRLRWFGHVSRMPEERLPGRLLRWTPTHGKRSRGRPKKSWLACVREDASLFTGREDITVEDMLGLASDRVGWRGLLRTRRNFLGAGHSSD